MVASKAMFRTRRATVAIVVLCLIALGVRASQNFLSSTTPDVAQINQEEQLGLTVLSGTASTDPVTTVRADVAFIVAIDNIGVTAVELTLHGSYGIRQFTALGIDGQANITVPPADHAESGVVLLVARSGDRVGWGEVTLLAGPAVDPIESMLGARTIVANARDHTMVVSIPVDTQGNPVPSGTAVDWTLTRKGNPEEVTTLSATTDHLLAFKQIIATTAAGTSKVAPVVDGAYGREASFIEVPGVPLAFDLQLLDPETVADGRSLVRVRTDELVDQFGNVMPDGTRVSLDVDSELGLDSRAPGQQTVSRLWGTTQQGRAQFVLEAPSRPASLQLTALASGAKSNQLTIDFAAAVTSIDVKLAPVDAGVRVQIGPVLTGRYGYVSDGTEVTIRSLSEGAEATRTLVTDTVVIDNGVASLLVPAATDKVQVSILGHTVEVMAQ